MKERPILFSAPMVRAILEGCKTQTRRMVKTKAMTTTICPYGCAGDRLWVKETFGIAYELAKGKIAPIEDIVYRANPRDQSSPLLWKPSIFMRREYSRITLEIVSVRVERLQDISDLDACAEGADGPQPTFQAGDVGESGPESFIAGYRQIWESINGKGSWAKNPWVWRVEFKVI